jgi:hypothetical protein
MPIRVEVNLRPLADELEDRRALPGGAVAAGDRVTLCVSEWLGDTAPFATIVVVVFGFGDATTGRVIEPVPDCLIEIRAGYILAFGPEHIIAIDDPPV